MLFPKITVVTPNFNGAEYLEETIKSVVLQGYPNLEYIIIDGGSTDESVEIIKKYENHLTYWISEPDNGLYDALQKGFEKSTGEIMGWINSDDMLHSNSLFTIAEVLALNDVKWIQGTHTHIDEIGRTIKCYNSKPWSKLKFLMGDYKWIQQESTFWRRELWDKAGAYINIKYKLAGDLDLWTRFFQFEKLYNINALVGGFRIRSKNQLSLDQMKDYEIEASKILNSITKTTQDYDRIDKVKRLLFQKKIISKSKVLNFVTIQNKIQNKINSLHNYPASIMFDRSKQKYYLNSTK